MSGGKFNYLDSELKSEIYGYADKVKNVFNDREISELVWDVLDLVHEYDWYMCGDTSSGTWNKKKKEFKDKWLTRKGQDIRWRKYIEEATEGLKRDLLNEKNVCGDCSNYIPSEDEKDSPYGDCKINPHCLWHYMEDACENFDKKSSI